MKKFTCVVLMFFFGSIVSCFCPDMESTTYKTIKSVYGTVYSFQPNGIFPYYDEFNRQELGIGIRPDSIAERVERVAAFSGINNAYACSDPTEIVYVNAIESLNITTVYDFDAAHPAGSNVNDILLYLNGMGNTADLEVNKLSSISHFLKFAAIPQQDSLQFRIQGEISGEGSFNVTTQLIVLE